MEIRSFWTVNQCSTKAVLFVEISVICAVFLFSFHIWDATVFIFLLWSKSDKFNINSKVHDLLPIVLCFASYLYLLQYCILMQHYAIFLHFMLLYHLILYCIVYIIPIKLHLNAQKHNLLYCFVLHRIVFPFCNLWHHIFNHTSFLILQDLLVTGGMSISSHIPCISVFVSYWARNLTQVACWQTYLSQILLWLHCSSP